MCNFCAEIQQWDWRFPHGGALMLCSVCISVWLTVLLANILLYFNVTWIDRRLRQILRQLLYFFFGGTKQIYSALCFLALFCSHPHLSFGFLYLVYCCTSSLPRAHMQKNVFVIHFLYIIHLIVLLFCSFDNLPFVSCWLLNLSVHESFQELGTLFYGQKSVDMNTGHFAQNTFHTSLLAQVLDRLHNS